MLKQILFGVDRGNIIQEIYSHDPREKTQYIMLHMEQ